MTLIHTERVLEVAQILYKFLDLNKLAYTIFLPIRLGTGNSPTTILDDSSSS